MSIEKVNIKDTSIKIRSLQANSLYRVNNGYKDAFLDYGKGMINNSLFSEYMLKHGVTMNKNNDSVDFIVMKYDYGVGEEIINGQQFPKISTQDLREHYYEQGATIYKEGKVKEGKSNTITYKMLMRSTGKAKEGDCIFIRDSLHKKALQYITMGLYEKMPNENAKIVELSAYSTLITATAIDYITLPLENIFVVKDEEVFTWKKAVTVKARDVEYTKQTLDYDKIEESLNELGFTFYKKKQKDNPHLNYIKKMKNSINEAGLSLNNFYKEESFIKKECYVDRTDTPSKISNILWDGMGLIDDSIFPNNMEGFIYCRSHFFKSCLFRGNLQKYFQNYYGETYNDAVETDMFGRKMKVSDIKVIITENSLKWMKFIDLMGGTKEAAFRYYEKFMKKHEQRFAIVKTAHASKWGKLQRSSYQINGSLPTTDEVILKNIAKVSIDYCNNLKLDEEAFINHLKINSSARYNINNVLIALNEWNDKFKYTKYFKDKKTDIISRFKKERLQLGKLLQYGDNLTICGNPIALMMKVTGQDFMQEPCFQQIEDGIQCYTTRFQDGERIAGFRSPHNSPNNIVYLENVYSDSIQTYFPKLGDNVIIINGIKTDVQSRLNGQDLDTDSIYATNQPDIVALAKKAYQEYPTIINGIKIQGTSEYEKSMKSYAQMDNDISAAQYAIGSASNIAQLALSYYYDSGSKSKELEDVFIICSVLAQVAIDSAKRNFEIKVTPELLRISNLECMKYTPKYPRFYAEVQKLKQRKSKKKRIAIEETDVGQYNCPMDILYRIIEENVIDLRKQKNLNTEIFALITVFDYDLEKIKGRDRKQHKKIISIIEEFDKDFQRLDKEDENYHKNALDEFERCATKLKKLIIKENTMYSLIAYAFRDGKDICDRLLTVLYDKSPDIFLNCFKKSEKSPQNMLNMLNL